MNSKCEMKKICDLESITHKCGGDVYIIGHVKEGTCVEVAIFRCKKCEAIFNALQTEEQEKYSEAS